MSGLVFGGVALLGLLFVARRAFWCRHAYAHGACGGHRYGAHGFGYRRGWRRGPRMGSDGFARAAGEVLKRRLGVDEEQEPIVDHALVDVRKALEELATELRDSRAALGDALRGETIDDAALSAVFARQDDALARARRQVVSAVKQVHAVLDADQRKAAADAVSKAVGCRL